MSSNYNCLYLSALDATVEAVESYSAIESESLNRPIRGAFQKTVPAMES